MVGRNATPHPGDYVSISFHIEWDMIVVTVFLSILNQMIFHLVQNRQENCHHDHIPLNLKINRMRVFSVREVYTPLGVAGTQLVALLKPLRTILNVLYGKVPWGPLIELLRPLIMV